jgi:hypothetical protein
VLLNLHFAARRILRWQKRVSRRNREIHNLL